MTRGRPGATNRCGARARAVRGHGRRRGLVRRRRHRWRGAQQDLIDSDPAVVKARADLEAAQLAAHEAEAKLEATTEQKAQVVADDRRAPAAHRRARPQRARSRSSRDTLLDHLRKRAVALYATGGDGTGAVDIFSGSVLDGARRKQLGDAAARSDHDNAEKLEAARATARRRRRTRCARSRTTSQHQQASLDALLGRPPAAAGRGRPTASPRPMPRSSAPGRSARCTRRTTRSSGPNTLTADQMLGWFDAQGYRPRLDGTSVAELASIFLEEGAAEGVRGDFAFAQAIVETGGFASAPDNNYSGLGWCDTCARGTVFPTPARRHPRPDPAPAQLRRRRLARRPTCTTRRRRTGGVPNAAARVRHTTSPRAGRPPGATWATATGPPTRTTRAR